MDCCEKVKAKYCNYNETKLKGSYLRTFFCSDNKTYVVKFLNRDFGKRILPNEYISGLLAKYLKLPCHEIKLVEVSDYLIEGDDNLSTYSEGTHIGIEYDFSSNVLTPWRLNKVSNIEDIVKILVFDQWIYNSDRGAEYSNWLISNVNGFLTIIDHSEAFGWRNWEIKNLLTTLNDTLSYTESEIVYSKLCNLMLPTFNFSLELEGFINQIRGVPYEVIEDIVKSVPNEWKINDVESQHIIDYLVSRQGNIKNLMSSRNNRLLVGTG
ncbi:HipA family kinase [Priestia flexa]|uniref:HipA family kinase n=1 Tax=Priestia flexa TaxID=86664 RepID=A0ABU4JAZ2_9BACI|nr:HipA family kinase [Priestia flexa]MCA1202526.1 hypothetical protein [Priestia flexa]MDW8518170.1 HipA family kinase [Priestia flexa]